MLVIRLQKVGRKHQPSFRLVVAERRSKLIAPPVEDLGFFQPASKDLSVKRERILHWITKGAQPTLTVHNLLVRSGVIPGPRKVIKTKSAPPKEVAAAVPSSAGPENNQTPVEAAA